jgi:hypothetical protein
MIGIVPFMCGIYAVYRYFFVEKSRAVFIFTALALTVFLFLFFKLITPSVGAVFLGTALVVLLSPCLNFLFGYFSKTKFSSYTPVLAVMIFIVFALNSIFPSFVFADSSMKEAVSDSDIRAFEWIRNNTPENSTVLVDVSKGNLVAFASNRKNVMDANFLMADNAAVRLDDINTIYNSKFETIALSLINKYDIDYIYLKDAELSYSNSKCFSLVYDDVVKIYEVECVLE